MGYSGNVVFPWGGSCLSTLKIGFSQYPISKRSGYAMHVFKTPLISTYLVLI